MSLVSVLLGRGKVRSEGFGETTEFGFSLVGEAELESVLRNGLVKDFETSVVSKNIESSSVRLPKESKPRSDEGSVGPVTTLLLTDGREEDRFGSFGGLEIFDICVFILLLD